MNEKYKGSVEARNERAQKIRLYRKERRELLAEIKRDRFLQEWLEESERRERDFQSNQFTDEQLTEVALAQGFRTARAWLAAYKDVARLLHNFVHDEAFQRLWATMRPYTDSAPFGYCPCKAGTPMRLVEAVLTWHKAPKFTSAERRTHSKKVAAACQLLVDLLEQIEPSYDVDMQFSHFRVTDEEQSDALFRIFRTPSSPNDSPILKTRNDLNQRLAIGGITPVWAVKKIKEMAEDGAPMSDALPAKVNAKGAQKTYYIGAVFKAVGLVDTYSLGIYALNVQLVADVVQVMSGLDCTADDVRKARPANY